MAPILGKRKRRDQIIDTGNTLPHPGDGDSSNVQALLRQHFESTFEPLPEPLAHEPLIQNSDTKASDDELESDWEGFSECEKEHAETIHYSTSASSTADVSKDDFKTFMVRGQIVTIHQNYADHILRQSAKPPCSTTIIASTAKRKQSNPIENEDSSTDAANLKKDLALQRLLKESHLLDSDSSLSYSGQNRHKALDLRLQDMGSKTSIFAQQKMPLAQRKGIAAKATEREELRRREAQENGIILEKKAKSRKKAHNVKQRSIDAPSVGKFQGGMLRLNKKDVAEIEGPKKIAGRKK